MAESLEIGLWIVADLKLRYFDANSPALHGPFVLAHHPDQSPLLLLYLGAYFVYA